MTQDNPSDGLIPETPIFVYPSLATSIGLEEATMLAVLTSISRCYRGQNSNGYTWYDLDENIFARLTPFWQAADIERICSSLRDRGLVIIASAPFLSSKQLKIALSSSALASNKSPTAPKPSAPAVSTGAKLIAPTWEPDNEALTRISQHNIPKQFSLEQVPEFVTYWRERGEPARAWGSKFMTHVIRKWRDYEMQQNAQRKETHMTRDWRPSEDALEVLTVHSAINLSFIEDAIPEFELYWREKGVKSDNWNKKFRDHVNRQWLRYQSACEHDPTPRRISESWQPSTDVYEVLQLANIDIAFAKSILPEFVIYYRDSNQVNSSWNTRFLQYIKQRWAKRHSETDSSNRSTRELSIAEQLTDRSWAL